MFGWFKKKKSYPVTDKVWMERKYVPAGIAQASGEKPQKGEKVFVCSYFEDVHEYFSREIKNFDPSFETHVMISPANLFNPSFSTLVKNELNAGRKVTVLFTGHYPMLEKENELFEKLFSLHNTNKPAFEFYISLEDEIFNTMEEKIKSLMQKLGGKPDEMLNHSMITSSIVRLQKKIQDKVNIETRTRNEKEWYVRNNIFQ